MNRMVVVAYAALLLSGCGAVVDIADGSTGETAEASDTGSESTGTATTTATTTPPSTTPPTTAPPMTTSPATTATTIPPSESSEVSVGSFSTGPTEFCGNGVVGPDEQCDGLDLQGFDCQSLGLGGGPLSCDESDCTLDTSLCGPQLGVCGDGFFDQGYEECDNGEFGGLTCEGLFFEGGELACTDLCTLDASGCTGDEGCGDGVAQLGEFCDGADLRGQSCETAGLSGPFLACNARCAFDFNDCEGDTGDCRDGVISTGEQCDGNDVQGLDCTSLGLGVGAVGCSPTQCTFDTTQCIAM